MRDAIRLADKMTAIYAAHAAKSGCSCATCRPVTIADMRMVLCPTCGNKRCPHATDHRHACTGSNESGQRGSSYGGLDV